MLCRTAACLSSAPPKLEGSSCTREHGRGCLCCCDRCHLNHAAAIAAATAASPTAATTIATAAQCRPLPPLPALCRGSFTSSQFIYNLTGKTFVDFSALALANMLYVNIHTVAYPAGAIRGQVVSSMSELPAAARALDVANWMCWAVRGGTGCVACLSPILPTPASHPATAAASHAFRPARPDPDSLAIPHPHPVACAGPFAGTYAAPASALCGPDQRFPVQGCRPGGGIAGVCPAVGRWRMLSKRIQPDDAWLLGLCNLSKQPHCLHLQRQLSTPSLQLRRASPWS